MSERDDIYAELKEAFDTDLADGIFDLTLTNYADEMYNPSTGIVEKVASESATTRGIFSSDWKYEVFNSNIEPDDEKLIILQAELSLTPSIGTEVLVSDKVHTDGTLKSQRTTRVVEVVEDPFNVTWELRVRF